MKRPLPRLFDLLAYVAWRGALGLAAVLPLETCGLVGENLARALFLCLPRYRGLVRRNLERAYRGELTSEQVDVLADAHLGALGRNLAQGAHSLSLSPGEAESRITYEGIEHARAHARSGKGAVVVLSHLGNWELYARMEPFGSDVRYGAFFQAVRNSLIDRHLSRLRGCHGRHTFSRSDGLAGPIRFLREGGVLGVLIDQHPGPRGVLCPFFGRLVHTTKLPEVLSRRAGVPIIPMRMQPEGPGHWRVIISPPVEPPVSRVSRRTGPAIAAELNRWLEDSIRKQPEEWFWVHNRWKTRPRGILAGQTPIAGVDEAGGMANLQPFRLAVWSPNPLGDACMALPAIRAIRGSRPDLHLAICCRENLAGFWNAQPEVDEVIAFPKGTRPWVVAGLIRKGRDRFDAALLFPGSTRSALESRLAGIGCRVGYARRGRDRLLSWAVPPGDGAEKRKHHVHTYLELVRAVGGGRADSGEGETTSARSSRPEPGRTEFHVGVCAGAEFGEAKRYPVDRFAEAIALLRERNPGNVFRFSFYGSPAERRIGDELKERVAAPCRNRVGETSIAGLVEELRTCDALLTNDTGTMHLAAATGIPVVAIFGSTEPSWTGPLGPDHRVIREKVDCSPCFQRECPIDFRCMLRIEPERVARELEDLLITRSP